LILEVHPKPDEAWSDGRQSLKPERFARLVEEMVAVAQAVGRDIAGNKAGAERLNGQVAEAVVG
jgi:3-deoxy-7-phosphoheptulonate synthase